MLASSSQHAIRVFTKAAVKINSEKVIARKARNFLSFREGCSCNLQRRYASTVVRMEQSSKGSRGEMWASNAGPVQYHPGVPLSRYNQQLQAYVGAGRTVEAIKLCALMRKEGVKPDRVTYNALMQVLAIEALHIEAWATYSDMKAMGHAPDIETYNHLLYSHRYTHPQAMFNIFEKMNADGIQPDAATYSLIIRRYIYGGNFELALQRLAEMNARGMVAPLNTARAVIDAAADLGLVRLALDLAEGFELSSVRRLEGEDWVKLLISSAQVLYADGVEHCWTKVVKSLSITPDEGLCLEVLHTASRHGLPSIAAEALQILEGLGVNYGEHHLAPLLEAFIVNGQIKEAFKVLELMRSSGIGPTSETTSPILKFIQRDPDAIDSAWAILEELHSEGQKVVIAASNVIIEASVFLGDLQRAIGVYKALPDMGIKPNVTTYNLLLSGCIQTKHRDLGDKLLTEMKEAAVQADSDTYEKLVTLCLTQATYEDAFFYLEEMKAQSFHPSCLLYESLIKKCFSVGDPRYKLAVEEIQQMGYQLSSQLRSFIAVDGKAAQEVESGPLPQSVRRTVHDQRLAEGGES